MWVTTTRSYLAKANGNTCYARPNLGRRLPGSTARFGDTTRGTKDARHRHSDMRSVGHYTLPVIAKQLRYFYTSRQVIDPEIFQRQPRPSTVTVATSGGVLGGVRDENSSTAGSVAPNSPPRQYFPCLDSPTVAIPKSPEVAVVDHRSAHRARCNLRRRATIPRSSASSLHRPVHSPRDEAESPSRGLR